MVVSEKQAVSHTISILGDCYLNKENPQNTLKEMRGKIEGVFEFILLKQNG